MIARRGAALALVLLTTACADSGSDAGGSTTVTAPDATAAVAEATVPAGTSGTPAAPSAPATDPGEPAGPPAALCGDASDASDASGASDVNGTSSADSASAEPVTITVWHYTSDRPLDRLEAEVAAFEEAHPDIDVQLVYHDGSKATLDAWRAAAPEDRPDLFLLSDDFIGSLAGDDTVLAFDDCLDASDATFVPQVAATYTVHDHLVAAPFLVSTPVMYFNATAFRDAGLDPQRPPHDLGELRDALEALVGSGVAPSGLALEAGAQSGGSWYVEQWLAQLGMPSLGDGNGRTGSTRSVGWDAPEAAEGLAFLDELVDDGLATMVDDSSGSADLLLMVSTDPAAMAVQTSASLGDVITVLEQGGFGDVELGVAPLPGPGDGGLVGGAAWWASAGTTPARRQATLELVRHLTSPAVQAQLAADTGYVPAREESFDEAVLLQAYEEHPQLAVAAEQIAAMPMEPASLVPVSRARSALRDLLGVAVASVLTGPVDASEALHAATVAAADLLVDT